MCGDAALWPDRAVTDTEVARFDVVLGKGGSGGGNALVHVHPLAEERFIISAERIKVIVEGREQIVAAGQSAVVPRGKPHYFVNAWNGNTEFTVEFRPAREHLFSLPTSPAMVTDMPAAHPDRAVALRSASVPVLMPEALG